MMDCCYLYTNELSLLRNCNVFYLRVESAIVKAYEIYLFTY